MARVELDLPSLYRDLAAEKVFRSQNIIDRPSNILHDRLTEFRLIDDGSFMALVDITIARNYTLRLASQNYVLLVFYLAGQLVLPWERGNRAAAGPGASVTVLWDSGRPWDYPRTIGQAYKQLSIFVDAAKLADQYGLRSTGFLRSGTGFSEAGRTRGRLFRCRFAEGMAGARRRVSMPFQ